MLKNVKPIIEKFPLIANFYRFIRDSYALTRKAKSTPYGFLWKGNKSILDGTFEPEEIKIASFFLEQVDQLINIGANQGLYSCLALSKNKKVMAFEPEPLNLKYLTKNIQINNWVSSIEVYPVAVSNKNGLEKLYGSSFGASLISGWGNNNDELYKLIPTIKLDSFVINKFQPYRNLIIIDIEGAEQKLLDGCPNLLNLDLKPIWIVEISIEEHQPKGFSINPNLVKTFQTFFEKGYRSFSADKNVQEIKLEQIKDIYKSKKNTLSTHNFIFLDKFYSENDLSDLRTFMKKK